MWGLLNSAMILVDGSLSRVSGETFGTTRTSATLGTLRFWALWFGFRVRLSDLVKYADFVTGCWGLGGPTSGGSLRSARSETKSQCTAWRCLGARIGSQLLLLGILSGASVGRASMRLELDASISAMHPGLRVWVHCTAIAAPRGKPPFLFNHTNLKPQSHLPLLKQRRIRRATKASYTQQFR